MSTATVTSEPKATSRELIPEQRVVLRNVGWEGYETLLRMVGDGHVRLTYDRGDVELMSPSSHHEEYKRLLGLIVQAVVEELRIPCRGLGSTTWRKQFEERGLEADECFYIRSFPQVRGVRKFKELGDKPAPDLAIEVEISRGALDRMGIYASLGISEVWRFDGEALTVELLGDDGTYSPGPTSKNLPMLEPAEIVHWVREAEVADDHAEWGRLLRDWIRDEVVPRQAND